MVLPHVGARDAAHGAQVLRVHATQAAVEVLGQAPRLSTVERDGWNDFVIGVVVPQASLDKEPTVQYEQDAWKPKQGLARVHRSSRKVGSWELDSSQTEFYVHDHVDTGLDKIAQELMATTEEAAKMAAELPGRARELLQVAVMTQAQQSGGASALTWIKRRQACRYSASKLVAVCKHVYAK